MRNTALYPGFIMVLAFFLLFGCGPPPDPEGSFKCEDIVSRRGNIARKVTAKGRVEPLDTILVKAPVEGIISEILVRKGDRVKKGQVLATVDLDPKFQLNFNQTLLTLKSARLNRQSLEKQIERSEQLRRDGLMAEVSIEELRRKRSEALLKEQVALERLREVEEKIGRKIDLDDSAPDGFPDMTSFIKAPISGTVLEVIANYGESVNPARKSSMLRGGGIFAIADLTRTVMRANVSELDISRIREGQAAWLRFDSMRDKSVQGKVSRIASFATVSSTSPGQEMSGDTRASRFEVEIELEKQEPAVRPGMSFKATFLTDSRQDALLLPVTAVLVDPSGDYVLARQESSYSKLPVTTGISDEHFVEITGGLEDGVPVCDRPLAWLENQALARSEQTPTVIDRVIGIFK